MRRGEKLSQFPYEKLVKPIDEVFEAPFEIKMIATAPFFHVSKQKRVKLFSIFLKDVKKTSIPKKRTDSVTKLPPEFYVFFELFFERKKKQTNYHHIGFTTIKSNL